MKLFARYAAIAVAVLGPGVVPAWSEQPETTREIITREGVAFATKEGTAYDVVAAFENRIRKADCAKFSTVHSGARWCFASQKNLDHFAKKPDDFVPAFGGRCTLGLALGSLGAKGDPRTAVLIGDRLVLNGSFGARAKFLTDTERYMDLADFNYRFGKSQGWIVPNEEVRAEGEN